MLTYNTQQKDLVLPEYGRNIQNMVDFCLSLTDRQERTACAHTIVNTMSTLFPASRNDEEAMRKFWDHLALMADYKLDIDWPFEVPQADSRTTQPETVPYDTGLISLRQYGRNIEAMINLIVDMEPSMERDMMLGMVANQMKKCLLADNRMEDPDERVYHDLYQLSKGAINLRPGDIALYDYDVIVPAGKKKKKK